MAPTRIVEKSVIKIGEAGLTLADIARSILCGKIDWAETLRLIEQGGVRSLPIVALSASFIGMAISVQFAREIVTRYGADAMVGGFVSISMVRELGPIFVAIVMAGSIGAAMTAEIGTMVVTDQIDALKVFRISPLDYLVIPRILATAISGPMLTTIGTFLAMLTGQLFTELLVKIPGEIFWDSVKFTIGSKDIIVMLSKSLVFAMAIAMIASYNGLTTKGGASAVGINTTKTVVWSLLAIFTLNYILTSLFFQMMD